MVENFKPGTLEKWGYGWKDVCEKYPKLIYASASGFGQTGPLKELPAYDMVVQGMGGLMSITGDPERGPMRVGIPIADLTAGLFCALGILTALVEREKSGEGQWLHTSLLQSQAFMLDFQAARWLMKEEVAPQVGNEHPTSIPTNRFLTQDGAVNIAVAGNETWRRLCDALGKPEWFEHADYKTNADRRENRDRLNGEIADIIATKTSAEWVDALTAAGVPCGPIYKIDEMFADPQVQHLGIAQPLSTVPFGDTHAMGQPVQLTRTPSQLVGSPPTRGEHTLEILEELGINADQAATLKDNSIV